MIHRRFLTGTALTVLLALGGGPLLKNASARRPTQKAPATWQELSKRIQAMNADTARFAAKCNAASAEDTRRRLALKARELDARGVTGAERQKALRHEAARLHRQEIRIVRVYLKNGKYQ